MIVDFLLAICVLSIFMLVLVKVFGAFGIYKYTKKICFCKYCGYCERGNGRCTLINYNVEDYDFCSFGKKIGDK